MPSPNGVTAEERLDWLEFQQRRWTMDGTRAELCDGETPPLRPIIVTGHRMYVLATVKRVALTPDEIAGEIQTTHHGKSFTYEVVFDESGFWKTVENFKSV